MLLEARNVNFAYVPDQPVVREVSASFPAGVITAILGPNGAGKSTLLRLLAGVRRPDAGSVQLNGRDMHDYTPETRARLAAFIPQSSGVAFPFTVREVVRMGLYASGRNGQAWENVEAALRLVGLAHRAGHAFDSLSAGQRQRATLARALAQLALADDRANPTGKVLLADEPVSAMDPANTLATLDLFASLAARGLCVVMVLHDLALALRYCQRAVILTGEGRIAGEGDVMTLLTEETLERLYGVKFQALQAEGRMVALLPRR